MKLLRHAAILEIIQQQEIETQEQLAAALCARGFQVTQATVSRDIKDLRLLKVLTGRGGYRYAIAEKADAWLSERLIRIFTESVQSIQSAGNIIVIKTLSGSANAAAEAVDALQWEEIVGSIAGDNTIFLAVPTPEVAQETVVRLRTLIK